MEVDGRLIASIEELVNQERIDELAKLLGELHPPDIAVILKELDREELQVYVLRLISAEDTALALHELDYGVQSRLLELLEPLMASKVLAEMPSDDIADLLSGLERDRALEILSLLKKDEAEDVKGLLVYREDTAGGIMTTELIALQEDMNVEETIRTLRKLAPDAETVYYLYVINGGGRLTGVLSLRELIIASPNTLLKRIMEKRVVSVHVDMDQEEVAKVVAKYDLLAVPVVDDEGVLMGIVTFDDIIDVLEEEATEDFYRMVGAGTDAAEEMVKGSPWVRAVKRLPWLVILLFGDFLSANVIRGFSSTLESVMALAYFIPVLMDMGGNVGTQSFGVIVRGLAVGKIDRREILATTIKEAQVGVLLGVACGVLVTVVTTIWHGSPILGVVVGLSMALTLVMAAVVGTLFPLLVDRMGVDTAIASGPFITTAVDVTGLLIYFWLATRLMEALL